MSRLSSARVGVSATFFAQGLGLAGVLTHLPTFQDRYGLDDLAVTGVMFAVAVLAGVGSTVAGAHAARGGSARTLRLALLVAAFGLLGTGFAGEKAVFLAGIAVYGLGLGTVDAAQNMQAVALETAVGRSILTSFHACWSAGGITGAVLTSLTPADAPGWGLVPIAVVAGAVAFGPRFPTAVQPASAAGTSAARAAAIGATTTGNAGESPLLSRGLLLLGISLVLFYVADSAASSWSTVYLRYGLSAAGWLAPLAYGAYQATSLISRLTGDLLVRRMGPVPVVRLAAGTGSVGLLLVVIAPGPVVAILGFAVLGLGLAVVAPLTFSAVGVLAGGGTPEQRRQRADALVARLNQFNYLGFVLGGVLTGLVSAAGSLRWGYVVPLVLTAVLIPLAPAFAPRRRSTPADVAPEELPR